ncbi:Uncharacterised protein [Klebsiella pneumoniae]|nr:hypothetical protein [Klebsiella pneumoniae]VGC39662.1 Uncharacterised protein [Klebsiella pneumoniae]
MHIDNYYGLHGWGFQGHHGIKGLYGNRNTFNRVDFHSFGYDVFFKDLTVKGRQINLQGGNEWSIEKLRLYITRTSGDAVEYFLNYAIGMRQDYASDCDGILNIDGVTVMWDRGLPAWYNTTRSFDLVRIIDTANSLDQGIDSKLPPTITIRNIVFDLAGIQTGRPNDNFEFCAVTALRSQFTDYAVTGRKTLLPDNITVDGMTAINVQPIQNAVMCGIKLPADLYQNTVGSRNKKGSDGTNARITLRNLHSVINNPSIELAAAQTVDIPGDAANWTTDYLNSDYSWIPRITLDNCIPAIIHTPGAKAVVNIDGVTVMWDRGLPAWYNTTRSFDLVRIIDTANSLDQGIDSKLPPTITIRNIVFDLAGIQTGRPNDNFEFCAVTALRSQFTDYAVTGRKTLLPDNITVDGMTAINVQPTQNAVMCGIKLPADLYQNTVGSRNKKGSDGTNARITLRNLHSVINNPSIELAAAQTVDIPGDAANWTTDYLNSDYSWIPRITLDNCIPAIIHTPGAKAVVDIHGGKLARVYTNGNGNRCRVTGADIELIPDASGVVYFAADKTLVTGCSWLNPTNGATYTGTLRGSGNEMIGDSAKAPNLPANAFI